MLFEFSFLVFRLSTDSQSQLRFGWFSVRLFKPDYIWTALGLECGGGDRCRCKLLLGQKASNISDFHLIVKWPIPIIRGNWNLYDTYSSILSLLFLDTKYWEIWMNNHHHIIIPNIRSCSRKYGMNNWQNLHLAGKSPTSDKNKVNITNPTPVFWD